MNCVSIICGNPSDLDPVLEALRGRDLALGVFNDFESWRSQVRVAQAAPADAPPPTADAPAGREQAILLVGSPRDFVEAQTVRSVIDQRPGIPVVLAGPAPAPREALRLGQQGASDLIVLPADHEALWRNVDHAMQQGQQSEPTRVRVEDLRRRLSGVTKAEHDVLDAMMEGLANKQTAQKLQIGLRTVELRRAKIMAKMDAKTVSELVKLVCEARAASV